MILGISGKQFFPHTPQLAFMWVWHVCPYVGCTSQSHPPPLALSHQPPHQRLKYQAYDLFPHGLSLCTNTSSNNATGLYSLFVIISIFTRRRWRCRPVEKKNNAKGYQDTASLALTHGMPMATLNRRYLFLFADRFRVPRIRLMETKTNIHLQSVSIHI
jgi:hypothetical protein